MIDNILVRGFYYLTRHLLLPIRMVQKRRDIYRYNTYVKPELVNIIGEKDSICVGFLLLNIAMWKSDKLLDLLNADNRFDVKIITTQVPQDSMEYKSESQKEIVGYFKHRGINVICGYCPESDTYLDLNSLGLDIVFYPQPYHPDLKKLPRNALFAYIPYCYPIEDNKSFHNWLFQNICWKVFAVSEDEKEYESSLWINGGENISVVGYPTADYFYDNHEVSEDCWKINDRSIKRIIWAPHHSIYSRDRLNYSTFLEIADLMLDYAQRNKDKFQFVFKPHPRLKDKLYKTPGWGIERTDAYYRRWMEGDNTSFVDCDYIDLFLSSDGMLHDCSSFMAEYLFTGNPVMYITKSKGKYDLLPSAVSLFDAHYKGSTIEEIDSFLNDVVVNGNDPMKTIRDNVLTNILLPNKSVTVANRIYNEICSIIKA